MAESRVHTELISRLAEDLGQADAVRLVAQLAEASGRTDLAAAVSALLAELADVSEKVAHAAATALPELHHRAGLAQVVAWLDVGIACAELSGATALKYFKDSPRVLGVIDSPDAHAAVLTVALELAEQDANVTLEYLRTDPHILTAVSADQVRAWLDVGLELMQTDVVVGLEYIRQIPAIAPVLPLAEVRNWVAFGMKLIAPNSLGKPDYLATMEFLRTSAAILGDIDHPSARAKVVALGTLLACHAPEAGITCLAESPRVLRALPSPDWQVKVLQYGALLAERDAESALAYFRRCPELVGLIGETGSAARFDNWFKAGMETLAYSPEGARAYFGLASQKALASVEEALSGVPLRQVARRIKLFVEGLCGTDVTIRPLPESVVGAPVRATVSADGRTIQLPALLRRYPTAEENERLYLVMAAHEAGHLEFGTYRLTLEPLADLVETVRQRYKRSAHTTPETLAALFRLYPHPRLAGDLWTVLEDARIEMLLQWHYPGLRRDLRQIASDAVTPRDPAHGLTAKELIVDCLLRLSTGESAEAAVPRAMQDEVAVLWNMCAPCLMPTAIAEDIVRLAHAVYVRLEELLAPKAAMIQSERPDDESQELGVGPTASEETGGEYRPMTNWVYRGAMNPEFIKRDNAEADRTRESQPDLDRTASQGGGSSEQSGRGQDGRGERETATGDVLAGGRSLPETVEEVLALEVDQQPLSEMMRDGVRTVQYPEWDAVIRDYRPRWCRVREQPAESGSDEFVAATLMSRQSAIRSLRRFFEGLRPPALRRVPGQSDGDDLDLDALVRRAAEQRAGTEGGEHVYVRRDKKERDVAVAVLVDISGSTSRQVDAGRRVIDIEKESLVLLCEALEAVGDHYALYAYSGQGRAQVDFLVVKDFDERLGGSAANRLGGLTPRQQNRDGAAIRHAAAKLLAREAKTRLLLLLSDGRPLDGDYKDDYSLEDTKAALREAGRNGVHPFCVTVDRHADEYLRRMYSDVQCAVIDRVEALPAALPRIYQRLTT